MCEMAKICGEIANYLTNGLEMRKLTQRFGKWPKYLGNGLDTWDTAWEMAQICGEMT